MGQSYGKNPSQTEDYGSPELNAYMAQTGGGGQNYGGIIRRQQQQPQTPTPDDSDTPPATPAGTRYGVWDGNSYHAELPWGLYTYSIGGQPLPNGQQAIGFSGVGPHDPRRGQLGGDTGSGAGDTGLFWDSTTGQVVGGDAQLDAYRSLWTPNLQDFGIQLEGRAPGQPTQNGMKTSGGWGRYFADLGNPMPAYGATEFMGYPITTTPFWWESANNPNFVHTATRSEGPEGFTWNFPAPLSGVSLPRTASRTPNVTYGGVPHDWTTAASGGLGGLGGSRSLSSGTGGGGGYGGSTLSSGYGGSLSGNPWGGLNGIEDAMTSASAFGRRRGRG